MTRSLPPGLKPGLWWNEELGYGWHSQPPMEYSGEYFANYQKLDDTPMGAALTRARVELVGKYVAPNTTLDIGIGGGRYVCASGGQGYDVSSEARKWLMDAGRWTDPYGCRRMISAVTCWDSLEHIPEPEKLLEKVREWLFVSMPIYDDLDSVYQSKHFKPGEHLHYWTLSGFVTWCEAQGFELQELNHAESELGREGITSFAFKRVG
jgi:hypothetical protein